MYKNLVTTVIATPVADCFPCFPCRDFSQTASGFASAWAADFSLFCGLQKAGS
jgi:hypothetical protein